MSESQHYEYKDFSEEEIVLTYKWKSWRRKSTNIVFLDSILEKYPNGKKLHDTYEKLNGKYNCHRMICTVIPGITKEKNTYEKVNVIFGIKEEYYDYSF